MTQPTWNIINDDALHALQLIPDNSVDTIITSPPFYGLRDYGTATWEGGDPHCDHQKETIRKRRNLAQAANACDGGNRKANDRADNNTIVLYYREACHKCGATRVDKQVGVEATPQQYVANLVTIFREAKRVLADHGSLWLNLGDSSARQAGDDSTKNPKSINTGQKTTLAAGCVPKGCNTPPPGLKPKDLIGIPWLTAKALQAGFSTCDNCHTELRTDLWPTHDNNPICINCAIKQQKHQIIQTEPGYFLRSDIIWAKGWSFCPDRAGNPMPESVTDRPTRAHEHIFLLTKNQHYYYDYVAVRETNTALNTQRNLRDVWAINLKGSTDNHFAAYPEALVVPMIQATCPQTVCNKCGKPHVRTVETTSQPHPNRYSQKPDAKQFNQDDNQYSDAGSLGVAHIITTTGFQPTCNCNTTTKPGSTLDPFAGSGTTITTAIKLNRNAIGIELNPQYAHLAKQKAAQAQQPLFAL